MEYLVEFEVEVPDGTSESEVEQRQRAEAAAAAGLAAEGHLLRLWRRTASRATRRRSACTPPTAEPSSMRCSARCRSRTGCR